MRRVSVPVRADTQVDIHFTLTHSLKFTLYSRGYCHLCDDMLQALRAFDVGRPYTVDVVDVDADPTLVQRYDELVPVLIGQLEGGVAQEICHYHLDHAALRDFLAARM